MVSGALLSLREIKHGKITETNLSNFLTFFNIKEKDKEKLVKESVKLNNYQPIVTFFQETPLLNVGGCEKRRAKIQQEILCKEEEERAHRKNQFLIMRLGALGFFSLAALFVFLKLILAGSYQNKKRLDGSLVAETKIGFTLNRPNVNVVDGLNYTNNLRGGGDASGPSCELQPSFDLLQVGNPEERLVGSNSLDKNLGLLTSTTPRYQVQILAKQLLEAPDFSYRATSGKNEPCTYSSVHTAAGGPTVHFSGEDLYVTFSSSKFYFGDFSKDNTRFFKRLDYLKRALAVAGNPHSVTYQQNVIVDGVVYSNKIQGDHLEGTRALAANGRTRASAVAVAKPKYLHDLHTETRKQVEQDLIFDAQTESTGTITYVYGNRNKTNLSANHTIETYFFNCKRDSRISLNKIDDKFFTTDVSRDDYIQAESDLLDLQQTSVLKMCREIGMSSGEMLANQKKRSVMNQCCTDVRRLITDIRSSVENARFSNEVFSVISIC